MQTSEKIELPDGGYFLVQIEEGPAVEKSGGIEKTGVPEKIAAEGFRYLDGALRMTVDSVQKAMQNSGAEEWTMELNVGFQGLAAIPVFLKNGANATLKVTATWTKAEETE